ncbi:MAG: glycosyltransferase 87 family protein, partial [Firmicutes bacterium]|nr:glycosyltransferase 87 family protein [Bacillota bacterium]
MVRMRSDFFYYWVAGRMMLSGVSPHDPDAWPQVYFALTGTHSVDLAFPYPPWSVLAALPLALLEPDRAAALWMAVTLGALGLVAVLILQDVPAQRRLHAAGIGALALAGFVPVVE